MKTLKDKRILILLIPFFAVILLYLLCQPDLHHGDSEDFQAWAKEDIQGWLDKNYVSMDDWESFVAALQSVEIQGDEHLTDAQKTAYWDSVVDFLQAHREGTREAWSRFRLNGNQPRTRSTNGVYHVKFYHRLIDRADRELEFHSYLPDLAESSNVWRENWGKPPTVKPPQTDQDYEDIFFQFLQEISPSNYFKGYFQAVCLDVVPGCWQFNGRNWNPNRRKPKSKRTQPPTAKNWKLSGEKAFFKLPTPSMENGETTSAIVL